MSRRLFIGLVALIVAMATTIWMLVLVREEPPPPPPQRAERPAAPDATDDATAEDRRRAAAAAASAAAGVSPAPAPAAPPPATVTPPVSDPVAVQPAAPPSASQEAARLQSSAPAPTHGEPRQQEAPPQPSAPPEAAVTANAVANAGKEGEAGKDATKPDAPSEQARTQPPAPPPVAALPAPLRETPAAVMPVAPPAPAVVAVPPPPPAPRGVMPSFDVVRIAPDGTAVIAGRAEPGALVQVMDGDKELGRATADSRGEWVVLPSGPIAPGTRELALLAKGPGDIPEAKSERVVVVVVPERQQTAQSAGALAVSMPRDTAAAEPSRALQVPSAGPRQAPPISLAVETVDYDASGNVVLAGKGPPGSTVIVYLDGTAIGRAVVDAAGRWSLTPEGAVAPGVYTLRVDQLGADGRVAQRVEMPFSRAEPSKELGTASNDRIVVQPGNSLWRIARRVYGEGTRYSVIYQANRDMIRDPDLIYPGQVFALPSGQTPKR